MCCTDFAAALFDIFFNRRSREINRGEANADAAANDETARGDPSTSTSTEDHGMAASSGHDYEVFLNFRGPDTRAGFVSYLYTTMIDWGIRVYKDDKDLPKGEEFGPELLQAIEQSKISIPIFSKGYASSTWCLKELDKMVNCRNNRGQMIMPIFYDVAPSEVRYQTGGFGLAFCSHKMKRRYPNEIISQWKAALYEVAALGGWDLHEKKNREEGEFAKRVTFDVLNRLKKAFLKVSDYLVDVDDQVDEIIEKINAPTSDTQIMVIHGMGGIGKTTIAKSIYNRLLPDFEHYCFLPNIGEKDIESLRMKLISDIFKRRGPYIENIDDGTQTIEEVLSDKKVLIILDNVEEENHINELLGRHQFGMGSKLIITTRNKNVLGEMCHQYKVKFMNDHQALQLFSKHAFRRDFPLDGFIDQSYRVIHIARGLPLTLQVIGSLLSRTKKEMWDSELARLESIPDRKVQCVLKISYDRLDPRQRHIFLDIACLFIGYDKDILFHFWDAYGPYQLHPKAVVNDLQNMSLIIIEKDNEVWMHDQLRDLGRNIVHEESKMKIEMQSRVWDPEEASNLLRKHKREKRVEALRLKLDDLKQFRFFYESFESLSDLKFLQVDGLMTNFRAKERSLWHELLSDVFQTNENSDLLPQLRWLSWRNIPPAFNITIFSMEDVVILNLSHSKITDDWKGWSHMKVMKNLKVLNLSFCDRLQRTPIFSSHPNLERLILYNCRSLIKIDPSICQLKCLVSLNLSLCVHLRRLPDELGRGLANLKFLSLLECNSLERLPDSIGNLKSLIKLDISNAKIKELPDSIRGLANLKFLSLSSCNSLERFPDSIGNLESLIKLEIFNTGIKELPDSIGNLKELKVVMMEQSKLSKIPDVLWSMGNLEDISASRPCGYGEGNFHVNIGKGIHKSQFLTTLTLMVADIYELPRLPESLIKLKLSDLRMDAFPDLSNLTNLKKMDLHFGQPHRGVNSDRRVMGYCPSRHRISLSKLEPLHVTPSPTNLALPPCLDSLHLCCFNLHHLPRLPSTLSSLHLENCAWFFSMEDLSNLKKLSFLDIHNPAIAEIQGLGCLENLRVLWLYELGQVKVLSDLTNLNKLTSLSVCSCDNLVEIQGEPQSLEELSITSCKSLWKLPNLSSSTGLQKVKIYECHDLVEIQGELPQSLKALMIYSCKSLQKLPNLSRFIGLQSINIKDCDNLVEIQGELSQSFVLLEIISCKSLRKLPSLSGLTRLFEIQGKLSQSLELRRVCIKNCDNVVEIPRLTQYLEVLEIDSCKSLQKLPYLSSLTRLQEVSIGHCNNLVEIPGELPQSLEKLKIVYCVSLQKLPYLSSLIGLREVCIQNCDNLVEIPGELPQSLGKLKIVYCVSLQKLPYLSSLIGLRKVCIQNCDNLVEIPGELPQSLGKLKIVYCVSLQKLPYLSSLIGLRKVCIQNCDNLVEIPGELPQSLEKLKIVYCVSLHKLPYLSSLIGLREVCIQNCDNLVEILGELPEFLEVLEIDSSCKSLQKLPYLSSLTKLRVLSIGHYNDLVEIQGELPQSLENLKIFYCGFLQKLPCLSSLARLQWVCIQNCDNLVEIPGQLPQSLVVLHICECQSLQKLPCLSSLARLQWVYIQNCDNLVEIPGQLPKSLVGLRIYECQSLQELPNLSSLKRLEWVCIKRCGKLNVQAISSLCLEKSIKFVGETTDESKSNVYVSQEDSESDSEYDFEEDE